LAEKLILARRIGAAVVTAICIGVYVLTQLANLVAIVHLPRDIQEAFIAMAEVSTWVAYSILTVGVVCAMLLAYDLFLRPLSATLPISSRSVQPQGDALAATKAGSERPSFWE